MKKALILILMAFAVGAHAQRVKFSLENHILTRDGQINTRLTQQIEDQVTNLLSDINRSAANGGALSLQSVNIDDAAATALMNMWENIRFKTSSTNITEKVVMDMEGFQVRDIPIRVLPPSDGSYKDNLDRELSVSFSFRGSITGVRFQAESKSVNSILQTGKEVKDLRERMEILKFVEDFRNYYVEKNIGALEKIFSDDALIITGKVIQQIKKGEVMAPNSNKIQYTKQDKVTYIRNLRALFDRTKYINVDFSDIMVKRNGATGKGHLYGVRLKQKWDTRNKAGGSYSDEGYLFLLWDFKDPKHPQIHVRTWQPSIVNNEPLPEEEIFTMDDFYVD